MTNDILGVRYFAIARIFICHSVTYPIVLQAIIPRRSGVKLNEFAMNVSMLKLSGKNDWVINKLVLENVIPHFTQDVFWDGVVLLN